MKDIFLLHHLGVFLSCIDTSYLDLKPRCHRQDLGCGLPRPEQGKLVLGMQRELQAKST